MNRILLSMVIIAVSLAGCQYLYDQWPCKISKETSNYVGEEPNYPIWPTISLAKDYRDTAITKNITTQIDLKFAMEKDKALYDRAIDQANINIASAESERATIVGTLSNPGWLLSFLLPASGMLAGRSITQLTHYSEAEMQEKITSVTNTNQAKPAA